MDRGKRATASSEGPRLPGEKKSTDDEPDVAQHQAGASTEQRVGSVAVRRIVPPVGRSRRCHKLGPTRLGVSGRRDRAEVNQAGRIPVSGIAVALVRFAGIAVSSASFSGGAGPSTLNQIWKNTTPKQVKRAPGESTGLRSRPITNGPSFPSIRLAPAAFSFLGEAGPAEPRADG
jgi:hypothetical protein